MIHSSPWHKMKKLCQGDFFLNGKSKSIGKSKIKLNRSFDFFQRTQFNNRNG